jgi:glycosyltransferase involved in cell wall biosynthesis
MLLMPSRSDGFGLVATEAIATGVPILVSEHTGIAELLRELLGSEAEPFVVPVRHDLERDAEAWAQRMDFILLDQSAADRRAADLYDRLSPTLSWTRAVQGLLDAMSSVRSPT